MTLGFVTTGMGCREVPPTPETLERDSLGVLVLQAGPDRERLGLAPIPFSATLPSFGDILDVAITATGQLVVLDPMGPSVVVLDATGAESARFGREGQGPGEFRAQGLTGLALVGDTVVVPDAFNQRVTLFDLEGRIVRELALRADEGFALDWRPHPDHGLVFRRLSDPQRLEAIGMLGADPRVLEELEGLPSPAEAGPLTALPTWCILPDGRLATGRTDEYRVTVGGAGLPTVRLRGSVGERPFGDAELEHLHEVVRTSLARSTQTEVDLDFVRDLMAQMPLPDMAPRLARLVCSDAGEVWVQHALPVRRMGPAVTRVGSPEAWESQVWDVFDPASHRVQVVHVPGRGRITRVIGDVVVGFDSDDSDVKAPARWRRVPGPPQGGSG